MARLRDSGADHSGGAERIGRGMNRQERQTASSISSDHGRFSATLNEGSRERFYDPQASECPAQQPQRQSALLRCGVAIREARLQDYEPIARLQARYGLQAGSYEKWSHLWLHNAAYKQQPQPWPMAWVLENAEQE